VSEQPTYPLVSAKRDFQRARKRAAMRSLLARLTGRSNDLLSFDEVRQKLKATVSGKRQLRDIPLDAIVGSVGRTSDFTRDFLPRTERDQERWARVKAAMNQLIGVPPIEVYQIGEAYFVLDGNPRVSVARESGHTHIQAYVTGVQSRVPLSLSTSPDDLIVKAEYAEFLERTCLDEARPGADLSMSVPGNYMLLEAQIESLRAILAQQRGQPVDVQEAAAQWYDTVYLPIVQIIRDQGILRDFPERTEADLYVWITQHRAELERALGWQVEPDIAASDLASQRSRSPARVAARIGGLLRGAVTPLALDSGPPPGAWRQTRHATPEDQHLLADMLVAIDGAAAGWRALDHAHFIAHQEGARLAGLHAVAAEQQRESAAVRAVRAEFERRCADAGVQARLAVEVGDAASLICDRARWLDLVVVSLSYPPGQEPIKRLRSGFRALVQRCPRPIVAVPGAAGTASRPRRALLPYDGSPKSEEALFIAAYLALRWKLALEVVTVAEGEQTTSAALDHARAYLEAHSVAATYQLAHGAVGDAILAAAQAHASDVILMGGYGFNALLEIVLGSSVDQVLRESRRPVLICQ
jgi:nucleotide-binding universal stress UspA family protein